MSFALIEATEEAPFSAITPTSMSTATTMDKVAVRRGRKGMLCIWKEDGAEVNILGVLISH